MTLLCPIKTKPQQSFCNQRRRRKKMKRGVKTTAKIPLDIIENILLKLPARSVAQFKLVSKPWLSLIFDPRFARTHSRLSLDHNQRERLLLITSSITPSLYHISLDDDDNEHNAAVHLTFAPATQNYSFVVVGSCNGLVCLHRSPDDSLYLLNPCTGVYNELPHSGDFCYVGVVYGFGYDSFNDDYKVLKSVVDNKVCRSGVTKLYSMKSNSWKEVSGCYLSGQKPGVYVNGALHWYTSNAFDSNDSMIVYSDFAEEKFNKVPFQYNENENELHGLCCMCKDCGIKLIVDLVVS